MTNQQLRIEALRLAIATDKQNPIERANDYMSFIKADDDPLRIGEQGPIMQNDGLSMQEALRLAAESGKWAKRPQRNKIQYENSGVLLNVFGEFPPFDREDIEATDYRVVD